MDLYFSKPGGGYFKSWGVNSSQNPNPYTFPMLLPRGIPLTWAAYEMGTPVGSGPFQNSCGDDTINLNLPPGPELVDVDVEVIAVCPNLNPVIEFRPSGPGYQIFGTIKSNSLLGGVIFIGYLTDGRITVKGLKLHATYTFSIITMEGQMYTNDYVIEGTSYTFTYIIPDATCNANFK